MRIKWQIDYSLKKKLAGVLALAEDQNGKITVDEVEKYFEEDGLSQEQMNLVCDYLLSMKMAVIGYKQAGGTVKEAENEEQQPLRPGRTEIRRRISAKSWRYE